MADSTNYTTYSVAQILGKIYDEDYNAIRVISMTSTSSSTSTTTTTSTSTTVT